MWRRYGDELYALLVLAIFSFEAVALGLLTWTFAIRAIPGVRGGHPPAVMIVALASTTLCLLAVGLYVLTYHALSTRRERGRRERLEQWRGRWVATLFEEEAPPQGPLPPEGEESLLDLREHLTGVEGEQVERLIGRYRIGQRLLRRSASPTGRGPARLLSSFRYRRVSARLEALEALAKARLAYSVKPLLGLLRDREPSIRLMAARGIARTLARMRQGRARDRAAVRFAQEIIAAAVPPGAVEEALVLLEGVAPPVIRLVLAAAGSDPPSGPARKARALIEARTQEERWALLVRVLDAAGRLKLLEVAEEVAAQLANPEPEVRAAALRTLGRLGILPPGSEEGVASALGDDVEYVRVQAARTAVLLDPETARPALWQLLGDDSWWVRRAAADALLRLGPRGPELLERAGRDHPDRYARHMAVQVLLDAGRLDADGARALQEAI